MDTNLRPSGIDGLGDMSRGTHFCLFYETKEDLLEFFIPFFQAGLEHDEFCLCVASEPLIAEEARRMMQKALPGFERYMAEGQIEITPHTDWYLKEGRFEEQRVLQGWIDKLDQALAKGFSGIRFAANILLEKRDWESFAHYEGKLEETLRGLRIEGLCAYDLNRYPAASVLDIIRHHQFTLARRNGAWQPLEGFKLKRAHEEVLKLNAELEQRVAERTAEFAATNEQLRREIAEPKRSEEARRASEARLQAAIDAADIGLWDWDLVSRQIIWLGHHEKLFGFAPSEFDGTYSSFEKRIHPEDLQELNRVVQRAREEGSEYAHE
jgi:PAS domain-containing protein